MLREGQRVFVYRNLTKMCWSVRDCKTRRVVAHLDRLSLSDATFKVSEAGRQRVLRERKKNVHAGIEGFYSSSGEASRLMFTDTYKCVRYDPYKRGSFFFKNGRSIEESNRVLFDSYGQVLVR